MRRAYVERPSPREPLVGLEVATRHRGGAEIPTELTLSPLETARGLLMIVILRDITERRRAEERLRRQNILLEEIARSERAAHEALKQLESQMVQSEKLAALGAWSRGWPTRSTIRWPSSATTWRSCNATWATCAT